MISSIDRPSRFDGFEVYSDVHGLVLNIEDMNRCGDVSNKKNGRIIGTLKCPTRMDSTSSSTDGDYLSIPSTPIEWEDICPGESRDASSSTSFSSSFGPLTVVSPIEESKSCFPGKIEEQSKVLSEPHIIAAWDSRLLERLSLEDDGWIIKNGPLPSITVEQCTPPNEEETMPLVNVDLTSRGNSSGLSESGQAGLSRW